MATKEQTEQLAKATEEQKAQDLAPEAKPEEPKASEQPTKSEEVKSGEEPSKEEESKEESKQNPAEAKKPEEKEEKPKTQDEEPKIEEVDPSKANKDEKATDKTEKAAEAKKKDPPKVYTSNEELFAAYEVAANEAVKIMLCNYGDLNLATEMGIGYSKNEFSEREIKALDKKMCCGFHIKKLRPVDKNLRVEIITKFTDLMVYDLLEEKDGVDLLDFTECLSEFMDEEYMVDADPEGINQIGNGLLEMRKELIESAITTHTIESKALDKWRDFHAQQQEKHPEYEVMFKKLTEHMVSSSDEGEEEGDGDDDGFWESDEEDNEEEEKKDDKKDDEKQGWKPPAKKQEPAGFDDGFETVTTKKRGRR